jgi:hypothetical protein
MASARIAVRSAPCGPALGSLCRSLANIHHRDVLLQRVCRQLRGNVFGLSQYRSFGWRVGTQYSGRRVQPAGLQQTLHRFDERRLSGGLASELSARTVLGIHTLSPSEFTLGDEFLLNNNVTRINLSFEELDSKLSLELTDWLRVYGGGGVLVRREPHIGRGTTQWGTEFRSRGTYFNGLVRPVAYADFQANERSNWIIGRSLMAGVQFENARAGDRQIQVLAEYYAGPSPDGQFFTHKVEWAGVGVHFYF